MSKISQSSHTRAVSPPGAACEKWPATSIAINQHAPPCHTLIKEQHKATSKQPSYWDLIQEPLITKWGVTAKGSWSQVPKVASSCPPPAGQQIFVISRTINEYCPLHDTPACRFAGWPTGWLTAMRSKSNPFITGFVLVPLPAVIKPQKREEEKRKETGQTWVVNYGMALGPFLLLVCYHVK